ncbi:MAG: hypothetical protein LBI19_04870 [Oscillospiraceae bacterium]|nr:hypothetical protein [Oscillospiraceae bacterium]
MNKKMVIAIIGDTETAKAMISAMCTNMDVHNIATDENANGKRSTTIAKVEIIYTENRLDIEAIVSGNILDIICCKSSPLKSPSNIDPLENFNYKNIYNTALDICNEADVFFAAIKDCYYDIQITEKILQDLFSQGYCKPFSFIYTSLDFRDECIYHMVKNAMGFLERYNEKYDDLGEEIKDHDFSDNDVGYPLLCPFLYDGESPYDDAQRKESIFNKLQYAKFLQNWFVNKMLDMHIEEVYSEVLSAMGDILKPNYIENYLLNLKDHSLNICSDLEIMSNDIFAVISGLISSLEYNESVKNTLHFILDYYTLNKKSIPIDWIEDIALYFRRDYPALSSCEDNIYEENKSLDKSSKIFMSEHPGWNKWFDKSQNIRDTIAQKYPQKQNELSAIIYITWMFLNTKIDCRKEFMKDFITKDFHNNIFDEDGRLRYDYVKTES